VWKGISNFFVNLPIGDHRYYIHQPTAAAAAAKKDKAALINHKIKGNTKGKKK
jgi:hypothetical protein